MRSFKFVVLVVLGAVVLAGCSRKPYVPVVQVAASDAAYQSVFVRSVDMVPTLEEIYPDETQRDPIEWLMERRNGLDTYTTNLFTGYFSANSIGAETEAPARYLLDIVVQDYLVEGGPKGLTYKTGVKYVVTEKAGGRTVFDQVVTTEKLVEYKTAWGSRIGGAVGGAVAAGISGGPSLYQTPAGLTVDDIEKTARSVNRSALPSNVHKALPMIRTALGAGAAPVVTPAETADTGS
jgi:hypothetical protein